MAIGGNSAVFAIGTVATALFAMNGSDLAAIFSAAAVLVTAVVGGVLSILKAIREMKVDVAQKLVEVDKKMAAVDKQVVVISEHTNGMHTEITKLTSEAEFHKGQERGRLAAEAKAAVEAKEKEAVATKEALAKAEAALKFAEGVRAGQTIPPAASAADKKLGEQADLPSPQIVGDMQVDAENVTVKREPK